MYECKDFADFDGFLRGDIIDAKVLKVNEHKKEGLRWVELTRRPAHMDKAVGLDGAMQARSLLKESALKVE